MDIDNIQVGSWYQRIDNPDRIVKVTRADTRVAFDIFDTDHQGRPSRSHSALAPDVFVRLYQPRS